MAVTLEQVYLKTKEQFELQLAAGAHGIKGVADWVHIVEQIDLIPFLRKREIIITTGIANMSEEELLLFFKSLHENMVCGVIVNTGPYIERIPQQILQFCDEVGFPVFTLPWKVKLEDLTHEICRYIVKNEQLEENIVEAFYDAMLYPEKRKENQNILNRYGYGEKTRYRIHAFRIEEGEKDYYLECWEELRVQIEIIVNRINSKYILLKDENILYLVIADYNKEEWKLFVQRLMEIKLNHEYKYYCAIGLESVGLSETANCFEKVSTLLRLAILRKQQIAYYDDLDIYKILLSVDDNRVLEELCSNTIDKLQQYDKINETCLMDMLSQYFRKNGSIQSLAQDNFIHRNTVKYQLKKIEGILQMDLENWDDRMKIYMALLAKDIV